MLLAQFPVSGDIKPIKKRWIRIDLKKALQHAHIESLAEAARACEEIHFTPIPTGSFNSFIKSPLTLEI